VGAGESENPEDVADELAMGGDGSAHIGKGLDAVGWLQTKGGAIRKRGGF
jgi:hypothetical protein